MTPLHNEGDCSILYLSKHYKCCQMFETLLVANEADYVPLPLSDEAPFIPDDKASPAQIVDGKVKALDWLKEMGFDDDAVTTQAEQKAAQDAFAAMTVPLDQEAQKTALAKVEVPAAVKHLVGMLTAYDWAFVDQAKEIRGYCIAQLLEESKHPDAKFRLKAIELLGKVTEVALFTERVEVKKAQMSDEELESEIKTRMDRYFKLAKTVEDAEVIEPVTEADDDSTGA